MMLFKYVPEDAIANWSSFPEKKKERDIDFGVTNLYLQVNR